VDDFGGGVTRTAEWRATVNEMGEIPVLEVDGERRTQTAPILLQLTERYGKFGGETPAEQFELLRWLFWDNQKLSGYMATYRFLRTFTPSVDPKFSNITGAARRFLGILDRHVGNNAFMIGTRPTVSDISMMAYLHYPVTRPATIRREPSQYQRMLGGWPRCRAGSRPTTCCPARA